MEHVNELLNQALSIATEAHKGQTDKGGKDYILHPIEVASLVDEAHQKILALLHDVVEDTPYTLDVIRSKGFPEVTLSSLNLLTKKDVDTYHEYILRVSLSKDCTAVKLADLSCNMNLDRLPSVKNHDLKRLSKYTFFNEALKRKIFTDVDFKCSIHFTSSLDKSLYRFDFEPSSGLFTAILIQGEDGLLYSNTKMEHSSLSKLVDSYLLLHLFD